MPGNLARPLSSAFQTIVKLAKVAVLVKDEDGYYVFANQAAEALLGYAPGQLAGKHMSDICPAAPRLIAMSFEQLKRDRAWTGQFVLRHQTSGFIRVGANCFTHEDPDGSTSYIDLIYPGTEDDGSNSQAQPPRRDDLTALDLCLLQLMVEGYTDDQLAVLLGTSSEDTRGLVRAIIRKLDASSRTEACVRAIKRHLIF